MLAIPFFTEYLENQNGRDPRRNHGLLSRELVSVMRYSPWRFLNWCRRDGDIGRSVILMPSARETALATAAGGGTIGTSPTPRTPSGCDGLGTSTRMVSIIGRSRQVGIR